MKWNRIESGWRHLKSDFMRQWPRLTHVDVIISNRGRLVHYIGERYGITMGEAELQLARWQNRQTGIGHFA
jgi:hypothetical protein